MEFTKKMRIFAVNCNNARTVVASRRQGEALVSELKKLNLVASLEEKDLFVTINVDESDFLKTDEELKEKYNDVEE